MKNTPRNIVEKPTICNLCGGEVKLIYVGKKHSNSGYIYKCRSCGASTNTQTNNHTIALGTLANEETKKLRHDCHLWFDKLWRNRDDREIWYDRLADYLGIDRQDCHFGAMEKDMLLKALDIIKKWWLERYDI